MRNSAAGSARRQVESEAGFTLIELMMSIAIVSILLVMALPTYVEYTTRSKVSEAVIFMAEAKTSVSEYYYSNRSMPGTNDQAGLLDPNGYGVYDHIARLAVSSTPVPGSITVTLSVPNSSIDRKQLQLVPSTNSSNELIWRCQAVPGATGLESRYLPTNCRSG
ncbi:prepilin-type N-terminal cleavage/methylation domain-containing protein [Mangrovimicrobium sediminis]|uniref:Prepilin-type N-terminal cleavage/methylation domain-containing protein n=1 Tax=Mangrovimicrobium sediminis TaxID=2562682 RepID=A0A4Z0M389_9GAMM|nr:pilin [Haliea sp. SAOS-164]TGD73914.1 prepilin-type N-terminal cleavage/methylation domain-containing protein [Haliea sp. SAOS-164]